MFGKIENGEMVLNEFGKIAYNEWMKTPEIRPNVELGEFIIMPNHIHGIIRLTGCRDESHSSDKLHSSDESHSSNNENGDLGESDGDRNRGECNSPLLRSPSKTIGSIVRGFKSSVTKKINELNHCNDFVVWQRNYHDHIIRNEQSYQNISKYIMNNPAKWVQD